MTIEFLIDSIINDLDTHKKMVWGEVEAGHCKAETTELYCRGIEKAKDIIKDIYAKNKKFITKYHG